MRSIVSRALLAVLMFFAGVQLALAARTTTYFHTDGLGSVVAATDQSGAVLWRKTYAPFGEQTDTQPDNERLSYTGKPYDDVTGLSYFGGRYYDPSLGRFASVDPVGFVESNPMSFNRYLYVNNNPYKYVDPDGEFLNFAAKFVLDVGVNIAFNYVTTGQLDVGGALKESAVGILNPAKTVAKAGKLVKVLSGAKKAAPSVKYNRKLHYGGSQTHSAEAKAARAAGEGEPCPACGQTQVSGTKTAPSPQHEPSLVEHYYEHGGHAMTDAERKAYAAKEGIKGTQCTTCQKREGAAMAKYSQQQAKKHGL